MQPWIRPGSPPGTSCSKGGGSDFWKNASSDKNDPGSVLRNLKMKQHLPDPFTSLAFSRRVRQLYVKEGRTGVSEFYGTWFPTFALLSSLEIKDKTFYEIFITLIPISFQRMTIETLH